MREERSDLRAQVFMMEREKKSMELVLSSQQAQESALKSHIGHLQKELESTEALVSNHLWSFVTCLPQRVLQFQRDCADSEENFRQNRDEMKHRITELLQTLEKVKRNSELRQQHQDEVIADLKRTNA